MAQRLVARWTSRSGKHHVALYHDAFGYFYNATGGSGYLGKLASDEAAIRALEPRVNDFQPDRNRTPMLRTNPAMHVASLLFDKRVFTAAQAKAWAHAHGYRYGDLEAGGPASRYWHLPQQLTGRVKRIVPFGSSASGIRAIVARNPQPVCRRCGLRHPPYTCREGGRRNPGDPRVIVGVAPAKLFKYRYHPGALDLVDPHVIVGTRLQPGAYVRVLAKRPAGGRTIRGWGKTFAWIQDQHGNEQIVFRRALHKA
jgi:hypothetical protein